MPLYFQLQVDAATRLAVWKIAEDEAFFLGTVPLNRAIAHPHKRLQHLAGRYLLRFLFADFPVDLIQIADTRKPFLPDEAYHFSISHCGAYAAAIASFASRVGIDVEVPTQKVLRIAKKFLHPTELERLGGNAGIETVTTLWSVKEALFKWWGGDGIDFSEMLRVDTMPLEKEGFVESRFVKEETNVALPVQYKRFDGFVLAWAQTAIQNQR